MAKRKPKGHARERRGQRAASILDRTPRGAPEAQSDGSEATSTERIDPRVRPYYSLPEASLRMLAARFQGAGESVDDLVARWKQDAARKAVAEDHGSLWFTAANNMRDLYLTRWIKRTYFNNWPDRELLSPERQRIVQIADNLVNRAMHVANELAQADCTGLIARKYVNEVRAMCESDAQRDRAGWMGMVRLVSGTAKHLAYYGKRATTAEDKNTVYVGTWCRQYSAEVTDEKARDAINGWMKPRSRWKAMHALAEACGFRPPSAAVMRRQFSAAAVQERAFTAEAFASMTKHEASSEK